jgi:SAM-dependent methyltransferase
MRHPTGGPVRRALVPLARAARRARRAGDRLLYPETASPAEHGQRVVLNTKVSERIDALDAPRLRAAEISGDAYAGIPWKEHRSLNHPEFDLCAPIAEPRRFDVVICEQVLEHVPDPWLAAEHLRELTVPGGHVIVSTPFLIRVHELPQYGLRDYWRFAPRGLRTLLERAGLEVESVEAWGNRQCVVGNLSRWSALQPWHSLRNEPDVAVQVWAFARRPRRWSRRLVRPSVGGFIPKAAAYLTRG